MPKFVILRQPGRKAVYVKTVRGTYEQALAKAQEIADHLGERAIIHNGKKTGQGRSLTHVTPFREGT